MPSIYPQPFSSEASFPRCIFSPWIEECGKTAFAWDSRLFPSREVSLALFFFEIASEGRIDLRSGMTVNPNHSHGGESQ
jgi:hypothetical protein